MASIAASNPAYWRRIKDNDDFKEADARTAADFEGLSKGERRKITVAKMRDCLQPISNFIKLKCAVFRERSNVIEEQTMMMERLRKCSNMNEALEIVPELEALENKLDKLDTPLAFASKGDEQQQWLNAADYSDEWSLELDDQGNVKSAFRVWHVCQGGPSWNRCYTVIGGKAWTRLHENPLQKGQRWYCVVCGNKYRTKYGVLVELRHGQDVYFLLAQYPKKWNDIKHMRMERDIPNCATPKELYDRIMAVKPYTGDGMLRPARQSEVQPGKSTEDAWKFANPEVIEKMPVWNWNDLANFSKVLG